MENPSATATFTSKSFGTSKQNLYSASLLTEVVTMMTSRASLTMFTSGFLVMRLKKIQVCVHLAISRESKGPA